MNVWNILKQAAIKGGPAAIALALGSPELAGVLAVASASADGVKIAGQKIEDRTGWRPHKVAAPAAAIAGSVASVAVIDPGLPDQLCALAGQICANPSAMAAIPGVVMILWQVLASGFGKVAPAD